MKIYIVTSGEYSEYHICGVFTKKKLAKEYAKINGFSSQNYTIEEYEADKHQTDFDSGGEHMIIYILYDVANNRILNSDTDYDDGDCVEDYSYNLKTFYFSTPASSVKPNKNRDEQLLKIARDRYATYRYECEVEGRIPVYYTCPYCGRDTHSLICDHCFARLPADIKPLAPEEVMPIIDMGPTVQKNSRQ